MCFDVFGPQVRSQRNRAVPSAGERAKCLGYRPGQRSSEVCGALRLHVLDLAQEPNGGPLCPLALERLRVRKAHCLLLLRESFRPYVSRDQMQLAPGLVQVVGAPIQLLSQALEGGLRSGLQ